MVAWCTKAFKWMLTAFWEIVFMSSACTLSD